MLMKDVVNGKKVIYYTTKMKLQFEKDCQIKNSHFLKVNYSKMEFVFRTSSHRDSPFWRASYVLEPPPRF